MNPTLKDMINRGAVGFEDIFEAYAMMCIGQVRDITEDMVLDEGIAGIVNQGTDLSTEGLVKYAVDWALVTVPEMTGDIVDPSYVKKEDETWLEFIIRAHVEKFAKENKSLQFKLS